MIDTKVFYWSGLVCFSIIAICSVINFFIFYNVGNVFSHVASLASIVFNFMLIGFFYYLLKTQTSSLPDEGEEALKEALGEFNTK